VVGAAAGAVSNPSGDFSCSPFRARRREARAETTMLLEYFCELYLHNTR
jgi:hypothetical protein